MAGARPFRHHLDVWFSFSILMIVLVASGCMSMRYYAQAIHGQYQVLAHRERVGKLIANPKTPAKLRQQLQLVQELRKFAETDLKLPVGDSYNKYVDVHRKYVVWDVQAAPPYSLQPKTWWYPFLGSLAYRGYFSEKSARGYGERLTKKGFDVYVDGVEAYSTLGWFKDPLLNTFMDSGESELAELLFHELAHKRLFISSDTDFNEAFATAVGQEGTRRWLRSRNEESSLNAYDAELQRDQQFVGLVTQTRGRLQKLYSITPVAASAELKQEKKRVFDDLQAQYAELKTSWGGYSGYDAWFSRDVNNAKLNTVANYYDYVPGFQRLLEQNGGDLENFYVAVQRLSKQPKPERDRQLRSGLRPL